MRGFGAQLLGSFPALVAYASEHVITAFTNVCIVSSVSVTVTSIDQAKQSIELCPDRLPLLW